MTNSPQPERKPTDKALLLDLTYSVRSAFYRDTFGAFPDHSLRLPELMEVWPRGCLVEFESPRLGGLRITSTFGLSNADLPTDMMVSHVERSRDKVSQKDLISVRLTSSPEPLPAVGGRSGYGYEIVALSRAPAREGCPSMEVKALHYLSSHQLFSQRSNILDEINDSGATTYETLSSNSETVKQYVLARPWGNNIPEGTSLPYGSMTLVCLVEITPSEFAFSGVHGAGRLVEVMKQRGLLPINEPGRRAVV